METDNQISRIRNGVQIDGKDDTVNSVSITIILKDEDGKILLATGNTVPTNDSSGYAVGCIFLHSDGGVADALYTNEGTTSASDFNVSAGGAATTLAALTDTTITTPASGHLPIYDGDTSKWENQAISGDITLSKDGVAAIASDVIVNDDIKSDAGITLTKLENLTSAQIIVGSGANVPTAVAVSGDVSLGNDGATEVVDLTITSEAQGDILYFDGSNWVRLGAGTNGYYLKTQGAGQNPMWDSPSAGSASILTQSVTIEAGANDVTLSTTSQTVSAPTLTIPDFAGVADQFTFDTLATVLKNKTLDDASTKFGDTADPTKDLFFSLGGATTGKTMTIVSSQTDDRSLTLPDVTDTLIGKATTDTLTNKILSDDTCGFGDAADVTKFLEVELAGATTGKTMTIVSSQSDNRSITLPDATDTLVGKATTDTLTNKSIDADGAGNVISNINGDELDPSAGTTGAYGIPIVVPVANAGSADINVFSGNVPFKCRVIDAWSINTKAANNGNWKLTDGVNDVTETVGYGASDNALVRADAILDANHTLDTEALHLISSDGSDTAIVYVMLIRVD